MKWVFLSIVCGLASAQPQLPSNIFYSDLHWFRIVYPVGTERKTVRDEWTPKKYERESFKIRSPKGAVLYGRVAAFSGNTSQTDELVQIATDNVKHGCFQNAKESECWGEGYKIPPFNVTLKVAKKDWYVISGIQGDTVFYEKGLNGPTIFSVHVQYPVAAKAFFDPIVAEISKSLERYLYYRGKVLLVDRREEGGWLWFATPAGGADNDRTVCYYSETDAQKFDKLKEGQLVTVAGRPEQVQLRTASETVAGLYETSIKACVLVDPK